MPKFERLLKVPRSSRTIQLVINIPEASTPLAVTPVAVKPSRRARAWVVLKVAGPSTVAIAAIVISIMSLQGQAAANRDLEQSNAAAQQANAAAASARIRQEAEQVSFLQNELPRPPFTSLTVENLATTPIYEVTFQVDATANIIPTGRNGFLTKTLTIWLGNIPACSSATVSIVPGVTAALAKKAGLTTAEIGPNPVDVIVDSMSFADSSGIDWQYSGIGILQQVENLPKNTFTPDGFWSTKYQTAVGCA
jgi:type II secretory pathway pseudopilin PulG